MGICDTLGAGHPSSLPPPPVNSIHMLSCSGMQVCRSGREIEQEEMPATKCLLKANGRGQPTSHGVGRGLGGVPCTCSSLGPSGLGKIAFAHKTPWDKKTEAPNIHSWNQILAFRVLPPPSPDPTQRAAPFHPHWPAAPAQDPRRYRKMPAAPGTPPAS